MLFVLIFLFVMFLCNIFCMCLFEFLEYMCMMLYGYDADFFKNVVVSASRVS